MPSPSCPRQKKTRLSTAAAVAAESRDGAAAAVECHAANAVIDVGGRLVAPAPPWAYNRVLKLSREYVKHHSDGSNGLGENGSFAVAMQPDAAAIKEWARNCAQGDLSWCPWNTLSFRLEGGRGEFYGTQDPDDGPRHDLELADPRNPPLVHDQAALYLKAAAEFLPNVKATPPDVRIPVLEKFQSHWGFSAIAAAVAEMHMGTQSADQIVQIHQVTEKLLVAWRGKVLLESICLAVARGEDDDFE